MLERLVGDGRGSSHPLGVRVEHGLPYRAVRLGNTPGV